MAKAKGRDTENRFVAWARANGLPNLERRRLNGSKDLGDVTGWPGVVVEIKSGARIAIPQWLDELAAEKANAEAELGFVAVRPKGKPDAADWYIVMPLPEFWSVLKDAGWVPR